MYYSDSDSELASSEVEFAFRNADPTLLSAQVMFVQCDDRGPLSPLDNLPMGTTDGMLRLMTPVQRMMVEWRLTPNPHQIEIENVVDELVRRTEIRAEIRETMEFVSELLDGVVNRAWSQIQENSILFELAPTLDSNYESCGSLRFFSSDSGEGDGDVISSCHELVVESDYGEEESDYGETEKDHRGVDRDDVEEGNHCDEAGNSEEPREELHTCEKHISGSEADDESDDSNGAENSQHRGNVVITPNTGAEMPTITLQDLKNSRNGEKFKCLLCSKITTTLDQMKEHLKSKNHRDEANLAFTVQRICCPFCPTYRSKNLGQVVGHIKTQHPENQIHEVREGIMKRKREYFMSDLTTPIDFKKIHI